MQGPLGYLLRHVRKDGDGIDDLLARIKTLDFTAEAESGTPDEPPLGFFDDHPPDEEVPFSVLSPEHNIKIQRTGAVASFYFQISPRF